MFYSCLPAAHVPGTVHLKFEGTSTPVGLLATVFAVIIDIGTKPGIQQRGSHKVQNNSGPDHEFIDFSKSCVQFRFFLERNGCCFA